MKEAVNNILNKALIDHPLLEKCKASIEEAFLILKRCYSGGGKMLVCGNGGSAADSEHIVGELMKGFLLKRKICGADLERLKTSYPEEWMYLSNNLQGALPAISLVSQTSLSTAFINDVAADMVYAQQVYGYARKGDVLIGISTSGNSRNVINALMVAKALGIATIGMTGESGGLMSKHSDVIIKAPSALTYRIQELHLPIYHALCAMLEAEFFSEE